jgi:hypothetical protein
LPYAIQKEKEWDAIKPKEDDDEDYGAEDYGSEAPASDGEAEPAADAEDEE